MQNIKITHVFQGLEPLVQAIDNLAEAIRNQEAFVVPTDSASEQASAAAPESAAPQVSPAPEKRTSSISLDTVREKFVELARKGKREELKALLTEYNCDNVSSLPEDVWDEVYSRLEAM